MLFRIVKPNQSVVLTTNSRDIVLNEFTQLPEGEYDLQLLHNNGHPVTKRRRIKSVSWIPYALFALQLITSILAVVSLIGYYLLTIWIFG